MEALPVTTKPALLTPDVQRLLVNHLSETSKGKKVLGGMALEVVSASLPHAINLLIVGTGQQAPCADH